MGRKQGVRKAQERKKITKVRARDTKRETESNTERNKD